ncbi:ATP-binding protein [Ancylothrix sp. C2]|uniref:ATP-binding protein n=1 Tax=Ancylothrix sp. D3o TaxID=2953691 RepID=UPI0021BB7E03|nr:ATP-binding protein [Ancylothrix sp. D3o]MCT7948773.1 ATP-binding protein [Ancylothrix sp. D3o]
MKIAMRFEKPKNHRTRLHERKPVSQTIRLKVNTDLSALSQVLQWFDQLQQLSIPEMAWMQCQLALAEAFTNVVRHAHNGLPKETPIEVEASIFNEALEIKVWDCGKPFDLEAKFQQLQQHDEKYWTTVEGSRGIMLMNKITDRLTYTRTSDQRNCLVMVKSLAG